MMLENTFVVLYLLASSLLIGASVLGARVFRRWLNQRYQTVGQDKQADLQSANGVLNREIYDRQRAEAALKESATRLTLALKAAKAATWKWDRFTNQVSWSGETCRLLGYDSQTCEASFETWHQALHPDDRDLAKQCIYEVLDQQSDLYLEYRVVLPDGSIRWLADIGEMTCDSDGNSTGMIGIQLDITARKQAEIALQTLNQDLESRVQQRTAELYQSEERYRQLAEAMPTLICQFLPDSTLTYVNSTYCEYFNQDPDHLLGKRFLDFLPDQATRQAAQVHYMTLTPDRPTASYEHPIVKSDGSQGWQRWIDRAFFDEQGQITSFQSIGFDITDRKKAEAELQHRLAFEHLVSSISTHFVDLALDELDSGIAQALGQLTEFAGFDRSYLVLLSEDQAYGTLTYQWHASGVEPLSQDWQHIPSEPFTWWMDKLSRLQVIEVPDPAQLPPEAAAERQALESVGTQSLLAVPLSYNHSLMGYIGFAAVNHPKTWSTDAITLLRFTGELFANALQRRQTETALQQSENRFRALAANIPGVIYQYLIRTDGSDAFTYVSPGCRDLFELAPEAALQDSAAVWATVHPDDLASIKTSIDDSVATLTPWFWEGRIITLSGQRKWIQAISRPKRKANGDILWDSLMIDISDRKQAETQLRQSEQRFRRAIENAPFPIMIHAEDGEILQINAVWTELTGYTHHDIPTTRAWAQRAYGDQATHILETVITKKYTANSRWDEGEFAVTTSDGDQRLWQFSSAPLGPLPDGRRAVISIAADITQHRQAKQQLQQQQQLLRTVIDAVPNLIFVKDWDSRYLLANQAAADFYGTTVEALTGKTAADFHVKPEEFERFTQENRTVIQSGQSLFIPEEQETVAGGTSEWLQWYKQPLQIPGHEGTCVLGVGINITARKQAELALQQQVSREQVLNQVIRAIRSSLDLETIFSTATQAVAQLFDIGKVAIAQYQQQQQQWGYVNEYRMDPSLPDTLGFEVPDEGNPFAAQLKRLEVVLVNDTSTIEDSLNQTIAETLPGSWLLFPLEAEGEVWGALVFLRGLPSSPYSEDEVELAQRVADQLAIAIQQARLYQQVEQEKQKLLKSQTALLQAEQIANLGNWELDVATAAMTWSDNLFRIFGFDPAAPAPDFTEVMTNHVHPDDRPRLEQALARTMAEGLPYEIDLRIFRTDGSMGYMEARTEAIRDPQGQIVKVFGTSLDISDRKQAEAALRESEARWQFALEGSGDGVWDWHVQTNRVFYSPQWKAMLGYDDHEVGDGLAEWDSRIHPEDKAQCYAELQRHFRGEVPTYQAEHRVRCKDGHYKWILDRGKVIEWTADGEPLRVIGTHTDISDRKQTEVQIREVKQRLELATESAQIGIWDFDLVNSRLLWDDRMYDLYGIAPEQFSGAYEAWQQCVHPDDLPAADAAVQAAIAGERAFHTEFRVVWPDGQIRFIESHAIILRDGAGHAQRMIGVNWDISDRKRVEKNLRDSVATNRALLSAMPDLMLRISRDGIYRGGMSSREVPILLPIEQLIGKPLGEVLPDDLAQQRLASIEQAFQTGLTQIHEYQLLVNGEERYEEARCVVCGEDEVMLLVRDITDRKQIEASLRVRARQQSAVAQLGQIALAATDLDVVMEQATVLAAQGLGVEYCKVLEQLADGTGLLLRAGVGWYPGLVGQAIIGWDGNSQASYTLTVSEPVVVEELQTDPRFNGPSLLQDHQVVSGLSVIIQGNNQPYGVLGAHTTQRRQFSQDDVNFLQAVANILATAIDRRQAETDLQESEERFRQLAENIQEVFWMANADFTRILYVSPAYEMIWGRSCASLYDHITSFIEAIHPDDRDRALTTMQHCRQQGWEHEYRIIHPDGRQHWIWEQAFPIPDATGQIQRVVGICHDISHRKQAELEICQLNQALEQQNQHLEILVEQRTAELLTFINALPDYIYVVERDDMRILFCNEQLAAATCFGRRHAVQGKTLVECFPAEKATYFKQQNRRVFESGETLHLQESFSTPAGELQVDTYRIPLKRANGEVYALIGSSRDITELVTARQTLTQKTLQLEATNHELESFSYSVSHDLRAPLRHIHGFANALQQQLETHNALCDPKVAHYIQVIDSSSQKMAHLIDGLLTLSRIGRKPMTHSPVPLRSLVDEAIALVQNHTETVAAVEFVVGELPIAEGDATLLQQVLINLISNAVKFSRNTANPRIEIGSLPNGTIFVRDNGVGFRMEYADKLFGAFQRLHAQTEFEGTGIGLAIVQRIIRRHGGKIWAESSPHQGTTFYFTISRAI